MVYVSSMEVYGKVQDTGIPLKENQLGEVDLQSPRSCYPMGKHMEEQYCFLYQHEYGVPVKIARLAQTFGGGGLLRITGCICSLPARLMKEGIWTILECGKDGETYNVVNEASTMRIYEMAELVAVQIAKSKIQVKVEAEDAIEIGYAPDTGLRLSGEKLRKLGWRPPKGLVEMYEDVIRKLKRMGNYSFIINITCILCIYRLSMSYCGLPTVLRKIT